MTVVYPVYLIPDDPGYIVEVPDIGAATEGYSLAEAIAMARDLIGTMCTDMEDSGVVLPEGGSAAYQQREGCIRTLVDVDLTEYRKKLDYRMVRKNCTIPNYLNVEAEKMGINFSQVLQEALKEKLGMA